MKTHNYKYQYEVENKDIPDNCLLCGTKITEEEWCYEDYFVLFRGFTPEAFKGVICFNCIKNRKIK